MILQKDSTSLARPSPSSRPFPPDTQTLVSAAQPAPPPHPAPARLHMLDLRHAAQKAAGRISLLKHLRIALAPPSSLYCGAGGTVLGLAIAPCRQTASIPCRTFHLDHRSFSGRLWGLLCLWWQLSAGTGRSGRHCKQRWFGTQSAR